MNSELNQYVGYVEFLGKALGSNYEIVLHDTADLKNSIVAILNSFDDNPKDTGRFIAEILKSQKKKKRDYICNYPRATSYGKIMKSSIFFIRDKEDNIIGMLCINMKCDTLLKVQGILNGLLQFNPEEINDNSDISDTLGHGTAEPTLDTISKMVGEFGVDPERMSQGEREEIICDLFETGVFNLKGAVSKTAEILRVSEPSIYRYLNKIKKLRD